MNNGISIDWNVTKGNNFTNTELNGSAKGYMAQYRDRITKKIQRNYCAEVYKRGELQKGRLLWEEKVIVGRKGYYGKKRLLWEEKDNFCGYGINK